MVGRHAGTEDKVGEPSCHVAEERCLKVGEAQGLELDGDSRAATCHGETEVCIRTAWHRTTVHPQLEVVVEERQDEATSNDLRHGRPDGGIAPELGDKLRFRNTASDEHVEGTDEHAGPGDGVDVPASTELPGDAIYPEAFETVASSLDRRWR